MLDVGVAALLLYSAAPSSACGGFFSAPSFRPRTGSKWWRGVISMTYE